MTTSTSPGDWRAQKRYATVDGLQMAWWEAGDGPPFVLLHGNVSSSWLWREVVPPLSGLGRCIVPDLVGHGDSAKSRDPKDYRFSAQGRRLAALLRLLGVVEDVTLVLHDWGSALGFDWARRHPDQVSGIVYMEAIVRPLSWADHPAPDLFRAIRSETGASLVLDDGVLLDGLRHVVLRPLTEEETREWRRPFLTPEDRLPLLTWVRELPIEGEPADVVEAVSAYARWLSSTSVPKLFVNADPGDVLVGDSREFCRQFDAQTEVEVRGSHFLQEDSGAEIGDLIARWWRGEVGARRV